jgi:GST-like protein
MVEWTPPAKIEALFAAASGNQFASINRPTAGAREDKELPSGSAPVQLYSLATPNGINSDNSEMKLIETDYNII